MSGFSPNPDPIHVTGLSSTAGREARLQSEVLRLHHVLEANNIEMAQLRSALGECEELTKELADVLLSYHRQCMTASRGKMYERLTAEMADVLLSYHRQCLSASRGKIPRFRITVEPFYSVQETVQETHGSVSRAPTQAGQDSHLPSPFAYHMNPSQHSQSSRKGPLEGGEAPLSHSGGGFRFNRGSVEPCRESGWDIRWGKGVNDSGVDDDKTHTSMADTHSPLQDEEMRPERGETFSRPEISTHFAVDSEDFDQECENITSGQPSEGNDSHGKNDETTPNDPLDEDGFLAILKKLNVKSSVSKENGEGADGARDATLFRFSAHGMNAEGSRCDTEMVDSNTTPKTKKRPKPADTLGLAERFSTKSPLKAPFSPTPPSLIGAAPTDQVMGEPPKESYRKIRPSVRQDNARDDTANILEENQQSFKAWARSPASKGTGKGENQTSKLDPQGIDSNTSFQDLSDFRIGRRAGLEGMHLRKHISSYPEQNPFSNQDNRPHLARHVRTPLSSELLPPSNPPSESITPRTRRLFRESGLQESFTAKLDRFDKLIGGGVSAKGAEPSFGSNFSGSPPATNKMRKSVRPRMEQVVISESSSQDENKAPTKQQGILQESSNDKNSFGGKESLFAQKQQKAAGESNGRFFGDGLKFEVMPRSSALGSSQPFGENTSLNINRNVGKTRHATPTGTPAGVGGASAYENALMLIKNGAYQLRKVTPVSKRATRARRVSTRPFASSTFRRYLHARRQAVGHSEDDSD